MNNLPIHRNFVGGPWDGNSGCIAEHDRYARGKEVIRTVETLNIGGKPTKVVTLETVHFIYELDTDGDMVCLVAGTRDECELAMARKLSEGE